VSSSRRDRFAMGGAKLGGELVLVGVPRAGVINSPCRRLEARLKNVLIFSDKVLEAVQ
jgi:hypothetical protein